MTIASRHSGGAFVMSVSGMASSQANSLIRVGGIASGPGALFTFPLFSLWFICPGSIWGGGVAGKNAGRISRSDALTMARVEMMASFDSTNHMYIPHINS